MHWALFALGAAFLLCSFPFFYYPILEEIKRVDHGMIMFLIFPLIGIGALCFSWFMRKKYLVFGPTPLVLSPEIGQVGGQVGGRIELDKYWVKHDLIVTLNCINRYTTRSNNRNTAHHRVLWQKQDTPLHYKKASGSQIEFCFDVPAGQFTADTYKGRGKVYWEVIVEGIMNDVPFKRSWKIPVEEGEQASSIVISERHKETRLSAMEQKAEASVEQQINTKRTSGGLDIVSEQGRNQLTSLFFLLFGAIFAIVGYVTFDKYEPGLLVIGSVFLIVGCVILCNGLFLIGRKLECKINGDIVKTRRSLFGCLLNTNEGKLTSPEQLSLEVGISTTTNGKLTEIMAIYANVDSPSNKKIKLVEGIKGRKAGEAMKRKLEDALLNNNRFSR